jgi:hypothetical protein
MLSIQGKSSIFPEFLLFLPEDEHICGSIGTYSVKGTVGRVILGETSCRSLQKNVG